MFHQGDLQSGIALAIQQQKLVACFIHDPSSSTSQTWESEYLTANTCSGNVCGQIGSLIAEKAVLLKIEFGSQEAGFLNAFCPVESAPALVVIRNGQVLEKIDGESIEREEFLERLSKAVGLGEGKEEGKEAEGARQEETETGPNTAVERDVLESDPLIQSEEAQTGAQSPPLPSSNEQPSSQPPSSTQATTLLAERARRLEAERLRREADEKAARLARQKARQEQEAAASARQTNTTERNEQQKARDAWLYQQKQRKDEAKKERERVLQQIESDKQERKAAALRRKEGVGAGGGEFSEMLAESGARGVASGVRNGSCALQIRLFDGSSIKGKFAPDADLSTAVRTWVREASPEGGADIPYSFRQILAPKPSRTIEVGEEGKSLVDLGLAPSATLVLVPVAGAVDAYTGNAGYVGTAVNGAYWLAGTAYSFTTSLLGAIPGLGGSSSTPTASGAGSEGPYMAGTGDPQDLSNARGADMAGADSGQTGTKMRVKTLADQRAEQEGRGKEGAEFYNGNSSAFQGDEGGK